MRPVHPPHHRPGGGFRNLAPNSEPAGVGAVLRWMASRPFAPAPSSAFPAHLTPDHPDPRILTPRAPIDQLRVTWVGHSTFLLQVGGLNVLTDPVWGARASPVSFAGPARMLAPGIAFDALPPIDLVLLSHDHYDHCDLPTVRALAAQHAEARWLAPLGVASWLQQRGVRHVSEHDWHARIDGLPGGARAMCVPTQHFSGRGITTRNSTLWCGWALRTTSHTVWFVGDTALHPDFAAHSASIGPVDLLLLPIGAYEPRWFMRSVHMNPEDALAAVQAIASAHPGAPLPHVVGMHWGTFRLTDEPTHEPPQRMRVRWSEAGLPADRLHLPWPGVTLALAEGAP
jgi:N-acyl-phosphatidylethanolamine-hydrolysing phospholipase D